MARYASESLYDPGGSFRQTLTPRESGESGHVHRSASAQDSWGLQASSIFADDLTSLEAWGLAAIM